MRQVLAVIVGLASSFGLSCHDSLLGWASREGCMLGPVAIAPSSCGAGVGMYASRDVRPGELLFAVPKRLHACLDTALADADCGAEFTTRLEDGNAVSIFCAYIAKQHLCGDGVFAPYLGTLDLDAPADFVQFWSDEEVELFRGTPAHGRALEARAEADEAVALALGIASLRTSVQQRLAARGVTDCDAGALDDRIADAVRGAHSQVLSRAFDAVHDSGPGARELIPLLDVLQHAEPASVEYAREELPEEHGGEDSDASPGRSGPCTVARALRHIASGEELAHSYGDFPDYVFAANFVRPLATRTTERRSPAHLYPAPRAPAHLRPSPSLSHPPHLDSPTPAE